VRFDPFVSKHGRRKEEVHHAVVDVRDRQPFLWLPLALAAGQSEPIGPAEAAKRVNEKVTLRMEEKAAALRKGVCFLNSQEDLKSCEGQ
jgi:hypothetical protein